MNKTLLTILAAMSPVLAGAQPIPIDSFYTPGATWIEQVTSDYSDGHHTWHTEGNSLITVDRDTTISGTVCHLLYYAERTSSSWGWDSYSFLGLLRTSGSKVFFTKDPASFSTFGMFQAGQENQVYDFNLSVGGVAGRVNAWDSMGLHVTAIDSVQLSNGHYIPRYNGASYMETAASWIWGIGNAVGFLGNNANLTGVPPAKTNRTLLYCNGSFPIFFRVLPSAHL